MTINDINIEPQKQVRHTKILPNLVTTFKSPKPTILMKLKL